MSYTFDASRFLTLQKIWHDEGKATKDFIAIKKCPFCNDNNFHLAIHKSDGRVNCWKCGKHGLIEFIKRVLNVSYGAAKEILGHYGSVSNLPIEKRKTIKREFASCKLPEGSKTMLELHRSYLRDRGFNPEYLEKEYNLKGIGIIPGSKFNMRIIIPIIYKDIIVSYQGRDVSGIKWRSAYRTAKKTDETVFHKHILYNFDKIPGKSVVVTEGVTKVWRLGRGAVATFGFQWSMQQARLLSYFDNVFILFDKGEQAQESAHKLAELLSSQIKHTEVIELTHIKDPGDLSDEDALHLMKDLGIKEK